ncbi:MAG: FAD-dependent oxidoreductase [Candidatus Brocadiia bacterium]
MSEEEDENLEQAAIVAHQMKSPLGTLQSIVRTLLGGFAGELSEKQKDMLEGADRKCSEAMDTVKALLTLSEVRQEVSGGVGADIVSAVHEACHRHRDATAERNIELSCDVMPGAAWVKADSDALVEAVGALLDNAVKYTPEAGRIEVGVRIEEEGDELFLWVSDSGIGLPEDERESVFVPFFRASNARELESSGTGLGLPFVKAVIESAGGNISAGTSDLGGARFCVHIPLKTAPDTETGREEEPSFRALVIGGVAAGPKIAAKIKRIDPAAEVTIVERGQVLAYAGCGLPYYVAGEISDQRQLISTPEGTVRGPEYFEKVKSINVMNGTEAVEIDRERKRVLVRDLIGGDRDWLPYDKLALATGAEAVIPELPGTHLDNICSLHGLEHAERIRSTLAGNRARDVTIVGGGLIGIEMTESLVSAGSRVTLIEKEDQLLPDLLDPEMAGYLRQHFEKHGVRVRLNTRVTGFEGDNEVEGVETDRGTTPADLVILSTGVRPNVSLAEEAGVEIGETGAIAVDGRMCTSDPDIYAAGDCAESTCLVTGDPVYVPLGSTANKQGRVAAGNMCGREDEFPGIVRTTICKVFDFTVARAGLNERQAQEHGYEVVSSITPGLDRAHFMSDAEFIVLKLVAEAGTGRLLGIQAIGPGEAAKRVDVGVTAITAGMDLDLVSNLDLCYAPSYSEALDNIHTACNVVRNKINGDMKCVRPGEVMERLQAGEKMVLLDVRSPSEYRRSHIQGSVHIPLSALKGRIAELDREKETVVFSRVSLGAYEASRILTDRGFENVKVMEGGYFMWPHDGGEEG